MISSRDDQGKLLADEIHEEREERQYEITWRSDVRTKRGIIDLSPNYTEPNREDWR